MICQKLTHEGLKEFIEYINMCYEEQKRYEFPKDILEKYSIDLPDNKEIDSEKKFQNRYDMAKYLFEQLGEDFVLKYYNDVGVWSWFAALYFEQFCPSDKKVRRYDHYILALEDYKVPGTTVPTDYRHCVRTPVYVVYKLPEIAKAVIVSRNNSDSLYTMNDLVDQIMSRGFLYKCIPYQNVIKHLYIDSDGLAKQGCATKPKKEKNKRGKWSKGGYGGITRLVTVLKRLKIAYNLREMSSADIIEKAGSEFQKWITKVEKEL